MTNRTKKTLWLLAFAVFLVAGVANVILPFMFTRILGVFSIVLAAISMYAYIKTNGKDTPPIEETPEDKLMRYKHLLSEGAITQEEYMEVKKKILEQD